MPFPRKLLTEGESVVVELRPNWLYLGWPVVGAVAALALVIAVEVLVQKPGLLNWVLLVVVVAAAIWFGARALRWVTTGLVVTTTRIIERSGVLTRQGLEVRLDRVNELSYRQTLIGRIFREGQLLVETGGEAGVITFEHVNRPAAVQSLITQQIAALSRPQAGAYPGGYPAYYGPAPGQVGAAASRPPYPGMPPSVVSSPAESAPAVPTPAGPTVAERLVQLDELRQRGILSQEEFNAKKAELLQQL